MISPPRIDAAGEGALGTYIKRGEAAVYSAEEAVSSEGRVGVVSCDLPPGLMLLAVVPWKVCGPAPGASKVLMVPSAARTKP